MSDIVQQLMNDAYSNKAVINMLHNLCDAKITPAKPGPRILSTRGRTNNVDQRKGAETAVQAE